MKVLLTNDDGIEAEGLRALRSELALAGLDVVVVAPDGNRSGMARACTPRRAVGLTAVHGDPQAYACDGTPVDCVRLGLLTDLAADAVLVVSGINHGANLGDDTLYSATLGAGTEAALVGRPALCLSQQPGDGSFRFRDRGPHTFARSARVGARLAAAMIGSPPPGRAVVNVNVPGPDGDGPIEVTRLGRRPDGVGRIVETDGGFYLYGLPDDPPPAHEGGDGTDFAALARGSISATPMSLDWHDPGHAAALRAWLAGLAAGVTLTNALEAG